MKKNKTVAYLLAATLLVGGTFVGTKALFTDKVDVAGELKISTGDVDVEIANQTEWEVFRNGEEENTGTDHVTGSIDNIKPGDFLVKTIEIKNQGTLSAGLDLNQTDKMDLGVLKGFLTPDENVLVNGTQVNKDKFELAPGQSAIVQLKITANGGGEHNEDGHNKDEIEKTTIDLSSAWELNAAQQNPNGTK